MTEATLSPATITIANNKLKADDMIMLSGLRELDGRFPIAQVDGDKVTCDEVDWSDKHYPRILQRLGCVFNGLITFVR